MRCGNSQLLGRFSRFSGESSALLLESRRLSVAEPPPSAGRVRRPGGVTKEALCRGSRYAVVFAWTTRRLRECFAACRKKLWLLALSGNSHSSCTPGTEWQVVSLLDASRRRSLVRRLSRRRLLVERRWRLILPQRIEVSTASSDVHLHALAIRRFTLATPWTLQWLVAFAKRILASAAGVSLNTSVRTEIVVITLTLSRFFPLLGLTVPMGTTMVDKAEEGRPQLHRQRREPKVSIKVQIVFAWSLVGLAVCLGCGPKTDRLPISGKVTLDGVPLDSGSIRFNSQPGEKLQSAGAMISAGSFVIPAEKGLLPGVYIVQISSPDNDAPPIMIGGENGSPRFPVAPERIPPEYSEGSDKTVELTRDGGGEFNFDLTSAAKK